MATFDNYGTYAAGSTNWTAPFSVTQVQVQAWAGGGGGGGTNTSQGGEGGGGGGYAIGSTVAVTAGNSYAVVAGAGGTASATGAGGLGGNSFFGGSLVLALGGTGGARGTTSTLAGGGAGSVGDLKYSGGGGFGNAGTFGGGGGGGAGSAAAGTASAGSQGGAGGSGGGGAGGSATAIGTNFGGGGGGRRTTTTSKAGGAGQVILGWNLVPGTLDQKHYQFFDDATTLNGAAQLANQDTIITGTRGIPFRYRTEVANTGGTAGTLNRTIQWQGGGSSWASVGTTTTAPVYLTQSYYFNDGDATTQRLTGVGTFVAGAGKYSGSQTALGTITGNNNLEDEWNLVLGTAAVVGTYYELRSSNNGTAFAAYTKSGSVLAADYSGIHIDTNISSLGARLSGSVLGTLTTNNNNELVLAFISTNNNTGTGTTSVSGVTGLGGTWTPRATNNALNNVSGNDVEIWSAFITSPLTGTITVQTSDPAQTCFLNAVSFYVVGTNWASDSDAIGATGTAVGSSTNPSVSLTTTVNNSWVWGVSNDPYGTATFVPTSGQLMSGSATNSTDIQMYWSQYNKIYTASPASASISGTLGASHGWWTAAIEIKPPQVPGTPAAYSGFRSLIGVGI